MPKRYWFEISGYGIKHECVFSRLRVHDIYNLMLELLHLWHSYTKVHSQRRFVFLPLGKKDPNYITLFFSQ